MPVRLRRKGEKNVGWQPETQPKGKPPVEKTKGAETMQRLIDADALKRDLVKNGFRNDVDMMMTLETINNAPTIDAVPVRHGKWIPIMGLNRQNEKFICSECICQFDYKFNFCPNCGARMDAE